MASTKERKKEVDCEIKHLENKNMKRNNKPQQPIYRPGSGPLRKSAQGIDETESDTNIVLNSRQNQTKHSATDHRLNKLKSAGSSPRDTNLLVESTSAKLGDMSITDNKKKSKKPEKPLYIPRPAQTREIIHDDATDRQINDRVAHDSQVNGVDHYNSMERPHNPGRSKRYSNRIRTSENSDVHEEWRQNPQSRNVRQGSEPRAMSNQNYFSRMRDTKSVEPVIYPPRNYGNDKMNTKPPSGRRHSTNGLDAHKQMKNIDNLPPRFRKKYEENNLTGNNYTRNEEQWDGSSITFQGSQLSQQNYMPKQNYQNYSTLPSGVHHHRVQHQHAHQSNLIYCTLPNNRSRGRGRLQKDFDNHMGVCRPMTPEKLYKSPSDSRAPTPPPYVCSNESLHKTDGGVSIHMHNKIDEYKTAEEGKRFSEDRRLTDDKFRNNVDKYRNNFDKCRNYVDKCRNNVQKYRNNEHKFRNNEDRYRHNENYRSNLDRNCGDKNSNQNGASVNLYEKGFNENDEQNTPRPFRGSLEALLSPVSPPTPPEKEVKTSVPINNTILDWSEEVELNDRLEAEALSDALTRSSSIASLVEVSTKSLPVTNINKKSKKRKSKPGRRRSGSRNRDRSVDTQNKQSRNKNETARIRQNSVNSNDSRDNFKLPEQRKCRNLQDTMDGSYDRRNRSRNTSRDPSFDRARKSSCSEQENWRDEIRVRQNSEREMSVEPKEVRKGGLIVLPQPVQEPKTATNERPKFPDINRKPSNQGQKRLFDPNNPKKPIIVKSPTSRVAVPGFSDNTETPPPQLYTTDQFGNVRPAWYDENSDKWKICRYPDLLRDIIKADNELQYIISSGHILINWGSVVTFRSFLMQSLEYLLCKDIKFCQSENVEQHFWKILFYNIIEMMRKAIANDAANREQYKGFVLYLIDEGTKYFECLLDSLEEMFRFKINDFLGNNVTPQKGKNVGLALNSTQKIFLYLGDLLRYREQVNETSNYGKCRQLYIKAHEINPKNGKPYNQLALLAVYARRKLDAVYYYMRSLKSSNPVQSAKESLISLFDENRKKYEQGERKKREERLERARQHMKKKESETPVGHPNSLRRETWIRPDGGRRVHRTTSAVQEHQHLDSEEEDLAALTSVEVNKRFVTSYLHVHGKLITKIGMETFQEAALQMLKEFRALLQHSPVPLPCNRFLQLLALNMFAIESTQLKDPQLQSQSGYRSELQERALVVSLQMFSLILERCVSLLQEHAKSKVENSFPQDVQILLPAVKIWCDWMLCNSGIWNPPPSTQDYKVGASGDAWSRIASLMNLLEKIEKSPAAAALVSEQREGYEQVRLPEDAVLSGFTPLMHNVQEPKYVPKDFDMEAAQCALRLNKLIFFGTVILCGLEPPVLKLEIQNDYSEYVSVVRTSSGRSLPPSPPELNDDNDLFVESFSEDEDDAKEETIMDNAPSEIRDLLSRKVELEKRHRHQEIHRQRVQKILQQSIVSVHIEIRPKYLIPDTNCFIDYLEMIKSIASAHVYALMVPLVVLNELEGLGRGGKTPAPTPKGTPNTEHVVKVAESAKHALEFLSVKNTSVKCITTKGNIMSSSFFTVEDDSAVDSVLKNDDKILSSCLALCKVNKDQDVGGEPRKLYREVVLLTDDRNLRVKALARDVPVRELPDFIQWAGLG